MSEPPPFDHTRAAFWLVVGVIAYQGVVVAVGIGACIVDFISAGGILTGSKGHPQCDPNDRILDLLTSALSAALGFAAGMMRGGPPPPPPPPKG